MFKVFENVMTVRQVSMFIELSLVFSMFRIGVDRKFCTYCALVPWIDNRWTIRIFVVFFNLYVTIVRNRQCDGSQFTLRPTGRGKKLNFFKVYFYRQKPRSSDWNVCFGTQGQGFDSAGGNFSRTVSGVRCNPIIIYRNRSTDSATTLVVIT